jgi:hypothetical protein
MLNQNEYQSVAYQMLYSSSFDLKSVRVSHRPQKFTFDECARDGADWKRWLTGVDGRTIHLIVMIRKQRGRAGRYLSIGAQSDEIRSDLGNIIFRRREKPLSTVRCRSL